MRISSLLRLLFGSWVLSLAPSASAGTVVAMSLEQMSDRADAIFLGGILGAIFHYLRFGPAEVEDEG